MGSRYRRFANVEAHGVSDIYESFALSVANSMRLQKAIATLPRSKQQPNLVFASLRAVVSLPDSADDLEQTLLDNWSSISEVALSRSTQTNEPGRCAVFLPLLAAIDGPIAILEVGASAGLCLLPDKYNYNYQPNGRHLDSIDLIGNASVEFACLASSNTPFPQRQPDIVWRRGVDLNPLDVFSDEDTDWLKMLVWPGQVQRLERLTAAIEIAQQQPPEVLQGDLLTDLNAVASTAPNDATLVIFHTAVLAYVSEQKDRDRFRESVYDTNEIWLSCEGRSVFPDLVNGVTPSGRLSDFLLAKDGQPVAWAGPHGQHLNWL